MKTQLCIAAVILLSLVGCTKEAATCGRLAKEKVSVSISVPVGAMTKVTDISGESTVKSVQIFLFGENGELENYKTISGTTSVDFECIVGKKTVAALVNAPEVNDITTIAGLKGKVSMLEDNAKDSFVMFGSKSVDISPTTTSVKVDVSRLVARISISEIVNNIDYEPYKSAKVSLLRIYLINVAGDVNYGHTSYPELWLNKGKLEEIHYEDNNSLISSGQILEDLMSGMPYKTPHYFYCYPNQATEDTDISEGRRPTRLVVEVGISQRSFFYPITIPDVKSNHTYNVKLNIKGPGATNPDVSIVKSTAESVVEVLEWTEGFNENVTI